MTGFKELTKSEDEARTSEDKTSHFAQKTNLSDEKMAKFEEMQNILKETKELMAQMRRHNEEEITKEYRELDDKDVEEMTSPTLKFYSLLHDVVDIVFNFVSHFF